jgi:hypothetical protein
LYWNFSVGRKFRKMQYLGSKREKKLKSDESYTMRTFGLGD